MNDLEIIKRFISDYCLMMSDRPCAECEMKCRAYESAERMANRIAELEKEIETYEKNCCATCKHWFNGGMLYERCHKTGVQFERPFTQDTRFYLTKIKCSEWEAKSGGK